MRPILYLALIFLLFFASPAQAQSITPEGAQKLKALFEEIIDYQKVSAKAKGLAGVEYEGEVTVEPAGTYYAVTLPHMRMLYPDQSKLEVGMISINASPHTQAGQWKMAVALPTPMMMMNAAGKHIMRINIGAQQGSGIWDEKLRHFAKLDTAYKDVTVEGIQPAFNIKIPGLKIRSDLAQDAGGLWSGPGVLNISGLDVNLPEAGSKFHIETLNAGIQLEGYDPAQMRKNRELAAAKPATNPPGAQRPLSFLQDMISAVKGIKTDFDVTALRHTSKENTVSMVDKGHAGFDIFSPDATEADNVNFRMGYNGFSDGSASPELKDLQPTTVNMDLAFKKIPAQTFLTMAQDIVPGDEASMRNFLLKSMSLLTQSDSALKIMDTYAGNEDYKAEISGDVTPGPTPFQNPGTSLRAVFHNLEELQKKSHALSAKLAEGDARKFYQYNLFIDMITRIAKPETDAKGQPVKVVEITVNDQRRTMLNGQDLKLVMQDQIMSVLPAMMPPPPPM
jgi:hypothetical protein